MERVELRRGARNQTQGQGLRYDTTATENRDLNLAAGLARDRNYVVQNAKTWQREKQVMGFIPRRVSRYRTALYI